MHWGSTAEEAAFALPGDDLVPNANITATRAIAVAASAGVVWPWIAQLGQGRGGFYSYDFLENLAGCDIHSADEIGLQWQSIAVGDEVRLHPEIGLRVAALDRGTALVLRGGIRMGPNRAALRLHLGIRRPRRRRRNHASPRARALEYTRWWSAVLVEPVQLISFIMSRRMLRGIKHRAEQIGARAT